MNRNIYILLFAQFITAFADNAILFTAVVMVSQSSDLPSWYVPGLQAAFLLAFILLAPWVGPYADSRPKGRVLTVANWVKAGGAALLLFNVEPLLAYCIVGIGAAMYGPAKYGILPELVEPKLLVKANGWIEGSTILAILLGTVVGAWVAEKSISTGITMVVALYIGSALIALMIKRIQPEPKTPKPALKNFVTMTRGLLATSRARFATLGVSLFWGSAVVLRVLIVAWAPIALLLTDSSEIALLVVYIAVGIAVGSLVAPKLIPLGRLRRARFAAYLMGVCIILLSFVDSIETARIVLVLTGFCGGLFVVPINASLQDIGHRTIGSGGAVAVQHFFENFAMIVCTGIYALALSLSASPLTVMMVLGILVLIATFLVSWHLPPEDAVANEDNEKH